MQCIKPILIYSTQDLFQKLLILHTHLNLFYFFFSFRATSFGFLNALCKAAAVLGNLIFGSLVGITKAIPILLASTVLVCGGLVGLRLPDTRTQVLM